MTFGRNTMGMAVVLCGMLGVIEAASASPQGGEVPFTFQNGQIADANQVNANFEFLLAELATELAARDATIESLEARLASLEEFLPESRRELLDDVLPHLRVQNLEQIPDDGGTAKTVVFEGVNLQVINGAGATDTENGVGNLIVGYNEFGNPVGDERTGSHNIVGGRGSSHRSHGGLVVGDQNSIWGPFSSVSGGIGNWTLGTYSSISGGRRCVASGSYSSISAGVGNRTYGSGSSVTGGSQNMATELRSTVSGGQYNVASGSESSVSGGGSNTADGFRSSISGGRNNTATGYDSSVNGGQYCMATGSYSSVSGGSSRTVSGYFDWAAGGLFQDY